MLEQHYRNELYRIQDRQETGNQQMCEDTDETMSHLINECSKKKGRKKIPKYLDNIEGRVIHWEGKLNKYLELINRSEKIVKYQGDNSTYHC